MDSFDIRIEEHSNSNFDFSGRGTFRVDDNEIILDPSVLYYMTHNEILENNVTYYLPDVLLQLIDRAKENNEYTIFLKSFLKFWGEDFSENLEANNWSLFYKNLSKIKILPITSDDVPEEGENSYYSYYLNEFTDHDFYISMSPLRNILGDCIGKILEFSRKKGRLILSKTRTLARLLREKITSLELPKKIDLAAQAKQKVTGRIFNFKGGQGVKAFISISLSIAGFAMSYGALNVAGLVFAFVDPD